MNGIGYVCDQCGKTAVLAGDPYITAPSNWSLPEGWYLLFVAQPIQAAENERWEFCSVECIHEQTKPQGFRCDNCGKPMHEHGPRANCYVAVEQ